MNDAHIAQQTQTMDTQHAIANAQGIEQLPEHIRQHLPALVDAAQRARVHGRHHSRQVGAAVYTSTGHVYAGANLKPVAGNTPLRFCAETTAANAAHTAGELEHIEAVVTISNIRSDRDTNGTIRLCDICIQYFDTLFPNKTIWLVLMDDQFNMRITTLAALKKEVAPQ